MISKDIFEGHKSYAHKIIALWAFVLSLIMFYQAVGGSVINVNYFPAFPHNGEPIQVSIRVSNREPEPKVFALKVYVDGSLVADWLADVDAGAIREYHIVKLSSFHIGDSVRVYIDAIDVESGKVYYCSAMVPPFPPETFSSFISFASFSTTLMGYMTTLSYYTTTVTPSDGVNAGLVISLTLIGLLVFVELTDPTYGKIGERIRYLRRNFTREAIILLIIFLAMVTTKIIFIIYGV